MATGTTNYLTLKKAARALGVHEQTLRSWERKGLIQMAHLPNSGYRRVPLAEIERLQSAMLAQSSELPNPTAPQSTKPATVQLVPARRSSAALQQAETLAACVQQEIAAAELPLSFDEFMQESRGRTWLP